MEEGNESEQISDHFICAVCLDVLFKPIVLVCGHVTCFWCCQRSMDMRRQSHCPLCRHQYRFFPAICQTLHNFLKKMYPISYERRRKQTLEDEQKLLGPSPDVDPLVSDEPGPPSNFECEDNLSINPSPSEENNKSNDLDSVENCKSITVADVLCGSCNQLLFRPIVLNCGHVYCETCIAIPEDGVIKCQVCESRHPSGIPNVCKEFDYFLEEQFSSEYAVRRSTVQIQNVKLVKEAKDEDSKFIFPKEDENFLQWWTVNASKFHAGIGCDMCGMCPIIGERYKCKDCKEKSGYDLCGDCYKIGPKLIPGRFNQKHTQEHKLELVKLSINHDVIYRLVSGQLAVVSADRNRLNRTSEIASSSLHHENDNDNNDNNGNNNNGDMV